MHRRIGSLVIVLAVALLGGCGGSDDDDNAGDAAGADDTSSVTTAAPKASGGGVKDACGVFSVADITAAFGGEPGEGKASGGGSRTVCQYAAGTAVAVSDAGQYIGPEGATSANGGKCANVAGVGDKAYFCDIYGQVGQLVWVNGAVQYDVTAATVDQTKFTALAAKVS